MMYARPEFMCAVVLVASFLIECSQATHQVRAVSSSTTPSASAAPLLTFNPLPEATSCGSTSFTWKYNGPVNERMTLQVTDVNVTQAAPPSATTSSSSTSSSSSSTTSSLARSSSTTSSSATSSSTATSRITVRAAPISPINLTLVTGYNPTGLSYTWNPVNVSQGWYILSATISGNSTSQTSSPFFIRNGTNTSCLGVTSPNSHTITPSTSSSSSLVTSIPANSSSTSKVPRIVGITIGMAILITLLILLFIFTRKRKSGKIDGGNIKNTFFRWKGSRDSRGGIDGNVPKRHRSSRFHLTSQQGSITSTFGHEYDTSGIEKKGPDDQGLAMSSIPVLHRDHQPPRRRPDHTYSASSSSSNLNEFGKPSVRYSNQNSVDSSAVFPPSSRDSGQGSEMLRSHSLSTTGTHHSLSNSNDSPLQPPPSLGSKQAHRQSLGKKRKPAPVYHPSEDEPSSTTSAILSIPALQHSASIPETSLPQLSHKDSFGPGGIEGKPLHFLIPDMPLSQTS